VRVLHWHVHGAWSTAFVHGRHTYLLPSTPGRGPDGRGRAQTYAWPANAVELPLDRLRDEHVDVAVLQRTHELALVERWLGRRPGRDLPAVYVEHNTPKERVPDARHPLAHQTAIPIVHVTCFNQLFWDNGRAPTVVVEHGVVDPGHRYRGERRSAGVVVNEPVRRWRVTGTDLLAEFARTCPLEIFGMGVHELPTVLGLDGSHLVVTEDLPQHRMHAALAGCRAYLHPFRWTSLGLSLVEAMHLGLPVVALATTEAVDAVPPEAGVVSNRPDVLHGALRTFLADPDHAQEVGAAARAHALRRYSLDRFLAAWDHLLAEVTR
jgi:hypothetical protein